MKRIHPTYVPLIAVHAIVGLLACPWIAYGQSFSDSIATTASKGNGAVETRNIRGALAAAPVRVLLLRNGELLSGSVAVTAEQVFVFPTEGGQVNLARRDVAKICDAPTEAYEFLARQVPAADTAARIKLVEWCLSHDQLKAADNELQQLEKISTRTTELGVLRRRLAVKTSALNSAPMPTVTPVPASRPRERDVRSQVSAAALTEYSKRVQPLLMNGCAAATCHGRATTTAFQLNKPPRGFHSTQRLTQRNLKATLEQLNLASPAKSPLLEKAREAHGDQPAAFGVHHSKSFEMLLHWVEMITGPVEQPTATANRVAIKPNAGKFIGRATKLKTNPTADQDSGDLPVATTTPAEGENLPPLIDLSELPSIENSESLPAGVDPFDADVFNKAYGAKK